MAQLPIPKLPNKAKDEIVVPGLKQNLGSINKFSQTGYTTVFHPGEEGVTIHEPNTFQITTTTPPILQGLQKQRTIDGDSRQHRASGTTTKSE